MKSLQRGVVFCIDIAYTPVDNLLEHCSLLKHFLRFDKGGASKEIDILDWRMSGQLLNGIQTAFDDL